MHIIVLIIIYFSKEEFLFIVVQTAFGKTILFVEVFFFTSILAEHSFQYISISYF